MKRCGRESRARIAAGKCTAPALFAALLFPNAAAAPPTFNRDIAPIIFANCSRCHRPDQVAPFPLLTYNDVSKRGRQIIEVTQSRFMPPWLPARNNQALTFHGERGLTDSQVALIRQWIEAGAIEGDAAELPAAPVFKEGWTLGEPDLVLTMSEQYVLPAQTSDTIRTFVLSLPFEETRDVTAIDFDPGNRRAVHHASLLVDVTGAARNLDEADPQPGYPSMGDIGLNLAGSLGTLSPGGGPLTFPDGVGRRLPEQSDLSVELHFNGTGKPEPIQPRVAIYFAPQPIVHEILSFSLGSFFIDIAPGEKEHVVKDSVVLPISTRLLSLTPHAHYICRRMSVKAALPDQTVKRLLVIEDWDFNWQQEFRFLNPIDLPAGTTVEMEFSYDNSTDNPRNPSDPPKRVRAGATAADEMALVFLNLIAVDDSERPQLEKAHREKLLTRMREAQLKRGR